MGKFSAYKVPLKSLSQGVHHFQYVLDNKFFTNINSEESDIKRGNVAVDLQVKRTGSTFDLNFTLKGEVFFPCDRCLDDIAWEIDHTSKLVVKFGKDYSEESDEIVVIPEADGEINLAWFLYEFIALSIPLKKVHPPGKCNKAMTAQLDKHSVTSSDDAEEVSTEGLDLNESVSNRDADARWSDLNSGGYDD